MVKFELTFDSILIVTGCHLAFGRRNAVTAFLFLIIQHVLNSYLMPLESCITFFHNFLSNTLLGEHHVAKFNQFS